MKDGDKSKAQLLQELAVARQRIVELEAVERNRLYPPRHPTANQERLQFLLAAAPTVIYARKVSEDYGVTFISDAVRSVLGYNPHQFVDNSWFWAGHMHPEDRPRILAEMPQLFDKGHHTHEYRFLHKDGKYRWLQDTMKLVRDVHRNVVEVIGYWTDTTETKQSATELLHTESRSQALLNAIPDLIFRFDKSGTYLDAKAPPGELYRPPEQLLGKRLEQILPKEVAREALLGIGRALVSGETQLMEYQLDIKGQRHYYEARIRICGRDEVLCIIRDISERKQAEMALQESEQRFRTMADAAPVLIWMADTDQRYAYFNKRWLDYTGRSLEQELDNGWVDSIHPDDRQQYVNQYRDAFQARRPFSIEYRIRHRAGDYRWLLNTGIPRFNPTGDFLGYIGSCVDITARKQMEDELAAKERLYRTLIETIPHPISFGEADGQIIFQNQAWYQRTGLTADESLGMRWVDAVHLNDVERLMSIWKRACTLGEAYQAEYRCRARDGSYRTFHVIARPVANEAGDIVNWVAINTDVTERKQAEAELKDAHDRLEERVRERTAELSEANCALTAEVARRKDVEAALARNVDELARSNAELEQFAYISSHDLQEPLRIVRNYAELLAMRYRDQLDAQADKFIDYIVQGSTHMQQLISDLLTYSRIGKGDLYAVTTDAGMVLERLLSDIEPVIEETGAEISFDPLPKVMVDPTQLAQLLSNLINNAIKYRNQARPRIHISGTKTAEQAIFSVRDNGIGIEPQYFERIFGLFQRLHRHEEYPGTGIGLAICKRIVERHNGKIWVESNPSQGTTFYFSFPGSVPARIGSE